MALQPVSHQSVRALTRFVAVGVTALVLCAMVATTSASALTSRDLAPPVATSLTAANISILGTVQHLDLGFSATLTIEGTNTAVAGEDVLFFLHNPFPQRGPLPGLGCEATTNAQGVASCSISLTQVVYTLIPLGYSASFLGNAHYAPATAQGYYALSDPPAPKQTS
jgi:hypothetical protein